ncbi:class I tRNA ligase family protein, partial [bacterium]|nr:class I tRNA ligase family protein [bacterium]
SGSGLHVGHPKGYIATDTFARMKILQGYNVLHPMGWDAFGLPAENYALKNKVHPRVATEKNIKTFKEQLKKLGFTYDWEREINTTDPKFYKWTQWIFLQMFKKGLAFESHEPIIWCPSCKTGLANEDLEGGKCERCDSEVERKPMRQWVLRITDYADRMLEDLEKLPDWDESIREMQKNWIGRSEGARVKFSINGDEIEVFTTRPDTLFGATYFVLSPEHPLVEKITIDKQKKEVEKYIKFASSRSELERTELSKEKTGVFTGSFAINPVNGEKIPVWIADYVMMGYGTGAIMSVPAHDGRDLEFAKKYSLPIKQVVAPLYAAGEGHPDKVRNDKRTKKRNVVYVIIKNPKNNKFLIIKWPEYKCTTFVVGGIDEGEDLIEAGKREVLEETGYKNLKFIKQIGEEVHVNYYAKHKNENRYAVAKCLYFELENEEQEEISKEEKNKHKILWVEENKVEKGIIYDNFLHYWNIYKNKEIAACSDGIAVNSDFLDGLKTDDAKKEIISWLEKNGLGKKAVNYKLRDWVFSRQRYWGEPIPIVHCENCGPVAVPEKELPLELPEVEHYEPTGTGESPLADIKEWVNTKCPKCGGAGKRETNTMPQWAGSSWYYLRYIDPDNNKALIDKDKDKYWSPVDFYVGGAEHATRHLIYSRFWHKFLYDIGVVNYEEPYTRLQHVGLITAEDGRKMSKRWGNVINPDDIVEEYGADAMRVYEMFMGPFSRACAWNTNGIAGTRRFLERVWKLSEKISKDHKTNNKKLTTLLHKTIKKVGEDIEGFKINTAVSSLMIFVNALEKEEKMSQEVYEKFLVLVSPLAPHIAEELWAGLGYNESIFNPERLGWPEYDPELAKDETIDLVVQVNGKVRDIVEIDADIEEDEAKKIAQDSEKIKKWLENKRIVKIIFVKGKLINIVIK